MDHADHTSVLTGYGRKKAMRSFYYQNTWNLLKCIRYYIPLFCSDLRYHLRSLIFAYYCIDSLLYCPHQYRNQGQLGPAQEVLEYDIALPDTALEARGRVPDVHPDIGAGVGQLPAQLEVGHVFKHELLVAVVDVVDVQSQVVHIKEAHVRDVLKLAVHHKGPGGKVKKSISKSLTFYEVAYSCRSRHGPMSILELRKYPPSIHRSSSHKQTSLTSCMNGFNVKGIKYATHKGAQDMYICTICIYLMLVGCMVNAFVAYISFFLT